MFMARLRALGGEGLSSKSLSSLFSMRRVWSSSTTKLSAS